MKTTHLKHSTDVNSGLFESTVQQRSREVDIPQCSVAMENCCYGNNTVSVNVSVGQFKAGQSAIHLN